MRFVSMLALSATGLLLAACGGESSSLTLSDGLDVCGLNCPVVQPQTTSGGTAVSTLPKTATTTNTGNTTKTTGDTTIALEKSIIINPKNKLAVSRLTEADVPKTAKFEIDTKTDRNDLWPKAKLMDYYEFGTIFNNTVVTPDTLGGNYTEYRQISSSINSGTTVDESLQVWKWGNSYATQYRDTTSGAPNADHQAWSFGGKRTSAANLRTSGNATYSGRFASTALSSGFDNTVDQRQTLSYNGNWRVAGASSTSVDFASGSVASTLTPEFWSAYQTMNSAKGFKTLALGTDPATFLDPNSASYDPNYHPMMYTKLRLRGILAKDATKGNTITGSAYADSADGWITNSDTNPFAGALFGPDSGEFTGIFNLEAVAPSPIGGDLPVNDDRRVRIQHSGAVNGTTP
jgi:hypothetical protein